MMYRCTAVDRRRLLIATAMALILATAALHPAPASAATRSAPLRAQTAALSDGLPKEICDLLRLGVKPAVNGIIRMLSRGRIKTTVAGTLVVKLGFDPWCRGDFGRLRTVLPQVAAQRPAFTSQLGPFVFGLRASYYGDARYPDYLWAAASWSEFSASAPLRHNSLWYSVNGSSWRGPLPTRGLWVRRGDRVQFAVRVDDTAGHISPWIYS